VPKLTDADFRDTKNQETNKPIWLYRIQTTGDTEDDIYLAEYDIDVNYYKDAASPQKYTAFPIMHRGIEENRETGGIALHVIIANVSREIQAYLEYHDGLRERKVTIRQVFVEHLADPNAYLEDIYWVSTSSSTVRIAEFTLVSRLDLAAIRIPRRRYLKSYCQFRYKEEGCWLGTTASGDSAGSGDNEFYPPPGFTVGSPDSCERTMDECERHNNLARFGGFPGIPSGNIILVS